MKYVLAVSTPSQGSIITVGTIYEVHMALDKHYEEVENINDATSLQIIISPENPKSRVQTLVDHFISSPFKPYVIDIIEQKAKEYLDTNVKIKYTSSLSHKNGWVLRWGIIHNDDKNCTIDYSSACNRLLAVDIMNDAFGKEVSQTAVSEINSGSYFLYRLIEFLVVKWRYEEMKKQEDAANESIRKIRQVVHHVKEGHACL